MSQLNPFQGCYIPQLGEVGHTVDSHIAIGVWASLLMRISGLVEIVSKHSAALRALDAGAKNASIYSRG